MNTPDQYKDEAMRLLDHYPLDVCKRLAERLQRGGWELRQFDINVRIFDSIQWTAKVRIKTDVTSKTLAEKQRELFAVVEEMELTPTLFKAGEDKEFETVTHRKFDTSEAMGGHRVLRGHWYEFNLEFKPARQLELSVLTEEEA